ncbi:hypothetical protein LINPERPRIM_LOCUS41203 [Linum perenne]
MSLKQWLPLGSFSLSFIFRTNTHGFCRLFSSANESLSAVTELISKQHWSSLKLLLQTYDPNSLIHDLLDSGAKPELILSYFTWSHRELNLNHSLEVTFRVLHSLAYAGRYSKIRSFLHYFVSLCLPGSTQLALQCPYCESSYTDKDIRHVPLIENIVSIYKGLNAAFSMTARHSVSVASGQHSPSLQSKDE